MFSKSNPGFSNLDAHVAGKELRERRRRKCGRTKSVVFVFGAS
jgi:hypothetical protein